MDTAQCVYFFLMVFGTVFLVLSFLLGELSHLGGDVATGAFHGLDGLLHSLHIELPHGHDAIDSHAGDQTVSPISFRTIMAFITFFGITGTVATFYHASITVSLLAGVAVGLVVAYVVYRLTALVASQSRSTAATDADIKGQTGRVEVPIPAEGAGLVVLTLLGQNTSWAARTADGTPVPAGALVQILDRVGGTLIVAAR
jgi:membrane protein implicated in regulation of membrane protease activity